MNAGRSTARWATLAALAVSLAGGSAVQAAYGGEPFGARRSQPEVTVKLGFRHTEPEAEKHQGIPRGVFQVELAPSRLTQMRLRLGGIYYDFEYWDQQLLGPGYLFGAHVRSVPFFIRDDVFGPEGELLEQGYQRANVFGRITLGLEWQRQARLLFFYDGGVENYQPLSDTSEYFLPPENSYLHTFGLRLDGSKAQRDRHGRTTAESEGFIEVRYQKVENHSPWGLFTGPTPEGEFLFQYDDENRGRSLLVLVGFDFLMPLPENERWSLKGRYFWSNNVDRRTAVRIGGGMDLGLHQDRGYIHAYFPDEFLIEQALGGNSKWFKDLSTNLYWIVLFDYWYLKPLMPDEAGKRENKHLFAIGSGVGLKVFKGDLMIEYAYAWEAERGEKRHKGSHEISALFEVSF